MQRLIFSACLLIGTSVFFACSKNIAPLPPDVIQAMYFPPTGSNEWKQNSAAQLKWNETELNALYPYLESKHTKAFIIVKNGQIVAERYFGTFTADSNWYWASAGKTMTAFLVGIAQQEGLLNINHRTAQYLGAGWTGAPIAKENLITLKHQLTMTTGLNDGIGDLDCTAPACLQFKADAGSRWAYHNAPYTLLDRVVESATKMNFNNYFQQKIRNKIGMNGLWVKTVDGNNLYFSTARSMARFGLLMLNKGIWNSTAVLNDSAYFNQQISSSQSLNLSYGYLTWLNGKSSLMLPTSQLVFSTSLIPGAPADMYAALGKNDQKIYVVPSQQLVVIRMGNAADATNFELSGFDNELWSRLKMIMKY